MGAWSYDHYPLAVGLFETAIVLIEAAAIAIVLPPRQSNHRWPGFALGLVASLTANAISVIVGIILQ